MQNSLGYNFLTSTKQGTKSDVKAYDELVALCSLQSQVFHRVADRTHTPLQLALSPGPLCRFLVIASQFR